ncbi:MAG: NUDIX hydrolase [Saprospiraceae bacterium]|nr:MAG: NUDIX hydrolase [Saprospiraceae bacterium]
MTTEKWNLYTPDGQLTDKIHLRGEPMPPGYFHLVIHLWLTDEKGRYLIQKRAKTLASYPGVWAATGGSAIVGESSLQAVRRETKEELGLDLQPEKFHFVKRFNRNNHFVDLWKTTVSSDFLKHFKPTEEVDEVDFRFPHEIGQMLKSGNFFRYWDAYFEVLGIEVRG